MQLTRSLPIIATCLAAVVIVAACGGGGSSTNNPSDVSKIATATLPAKLPDPKILSGGVVQSGSSTGRYTIKSGDTLSAIAASFGVTLDDLLTANPGINPTALRAGDTIHLPDTTGAAPTPRPQTSPTAVTATEVPPTAAPATEAPPLPTNTPLPPPPAETPAPGATPTPASLGQTYTVQSGDIPETIAAKFGITVDALLAANPGVDPTNLQIGQVLIIPPPTP